MTEKEKYIGAYLDGYFSDKKVDFGIKYYSLLDIAISDAEKKWGLNNGFPNTNLIDEWLNKNGYPEIAKQVEEEALELENIFVFKRIKDINPYPMEGIFYPVYAKGVLRGLKEFRKPIEQKTIEQVFEWLTTQNYLTDLKETLIENYNNFKKEKRL